MAEADWLDIGPAEQLAGAPLHRLTARSRELAVSHKDGRFGVVSNACNHVGGPLGEGRLDGDYITCPWHNWKFHRCTGLGEPGFEEDAVPAYTVKVEAGRVLVDMASATRRSRAPHPPHPLARDLKRAAGPLRLAGIATSAMDEANPRFSGSDHLLRHALDAAAARGAETKLIRPDYPGLFHDTRDARLWAADFFAWYNSEHHHHGIALYTPETLYFGRLETAAAQRQAVLDAAFAAHPERFLRGRPIAKLPPRTVTINPVPPELEAVSADQILAADDPYQLFPFRSTEPPPPPIVETPGAPNANHVQ
jgi:nitrite reductase/ring-hydroxylating ferredoxin subunit